ncbi:MAG: rhomboid family intramembrane serine protease [Ignavibacteriae bacterium]|nr:rhomboid family intramembrane serine protease [Ignavibacteriota bacterium]MCB9215786.1 rhomboid family intramembrane serine protease [Ignavibacteria bacterium]
MDSLVTITIILTFFATTFYTLRNSFAFEKYLFRVDNILIDRQFYRIVTSGFLHNGWVHFGFNALSFYFFGQIVEASLPFYSYLLLYFGSLVGGSLLSLFIHRQHGDYSAVGASGAISGVMFAFAFLYPDSGIGMLFLPIHINAVIFCFLYTLISIYGIKRALGNIGHDAHLGGAITGLLLAAILEPDILRLHWDTFLILLLPTVIFMTLIVLKPEIMLIDRYTSYQFRRLREGKSEKKKVASADPEVEINRILDKINERGIESLTRSERKRLENAKL